MRHILKDITCTTTPVLLSLALIFCLVGEASARDVTLAWDSNRGVDGYKIYYKPGDGGGRKLENYNGKDAAEGDSPIDVPVYRNESSDDPTIFEFTLHDLADNKPYAFVVTAYNDEGLESSGSREIQVLNPDDDIPAPYNNTYNMGWRITAGDLEGFTVYYHDSVGVVPTLGPTDDIPTLRQSISDVQGVGAPLNLQPSGTHFSPPVMLFIPCPGYSDASSLDIYYYDENRQEWFLAHDADEPGVIQPDAVGWLVPGSRINHNETNPTTIEIQVYHFSGVQAGVGAGSQVVSSSGGSGSVAPAGGGAGGCFISAITERRQ